MFISIEPGQRYVPSPWRKVRDIYAVAVLFSALIAAVVTLASPTLASLLRWLFIVETIALTSLTIGTLLSRLRFLRQLTPRSAHLIIGGIAIPAGYVVGSSIAYGVLREPLPIFQPEPRRIVALLATGLAALFIVYLDAMRQRIENEAVARIEAQRQAAETQLRLLRAQLEPHMLFNTLANLRALIDVDPARAQAMMDQVIVYLRSALAASRAEVVTLGQEFAQLRAYLEIMAVRLGSRLTYAFDLPEALRDVRIPPMLLQPLVENSIKHGIEPKVGPSTLRIEASAQGNAIEIAVIDSGLGGPVQTADPSTPVAASAPANVIQSSYGLEHVRTRLHTFYGPLATLSLRRNVPEGMCATVRIPR